MKRTYGVLIVYVISAIFCILSLNLIQTYSVQHTNGNGVKYILDAGHGLPDGGAVGAPLSVAIALDGEPILTSKAIYQPTVTAEDPVTSVGFGNVTSTAIITVPKGCCFNISVENTSESATPATTPAPTILVQNANLTVTRIA